MKLMKQRVRYGEVGLVYRDGRFDRLLEPGVHWLFQGSRKVRVDIEDESSVWMTGNEARQLRDGGHLEGRVLYVDLRDREYALLRIDGRIVSLLGKGLHALFTRMRKVEVEYLSSTGARLVHKDLPVILATAGTAVHLKMAEVPEGSVGVLYVDGAVKEVLPAGRYALWKDANAKVVTLDQREQVLDLSGQELMSQDKVTLRLNALLTYRITDPRKAVENVSDATQALYREAQLVLRTEIGSRSLDALLSDKESLADSASKILAAKAARMGVEVYSLGIRDVILPGEMKDLLNRVIEAGKAAEANAIKRREETAAMRSQLNTAKLMESNPVLMRLRELEVLEAVAQTTNLSVVLGEQKLSERISKLI